MAAALKRRSIMAEIDRLKPGTLLYKGTQDPWDPMTGDSVFTNIGIARNKYKWFSTDPKIAEIYARNQNGSVWVYTVKKNIFLLRVYDQNDPMVAFTTLGVLDEVISNNYGIFDTDDKWKTSLKLGETPKDVILKLPFGFITNHDQYHVLGLEIPKDLPINVLQRKSYHNFDKYLVLFMEEFKQEIVYAFFNRRGVTDLSSISDAPRLEFIENGIDGYIASEWKTDWHKPQFHQELAIFDTKYKDLAATNTPIIFTGRYKLDSQGNRYWVQAPDPLYHPQTTPHHYSGHLGPIEFDEHSTPINSFVMTAPIGLGAMKDDIPLQKIIRDSCLPPYIAQTIAQAQTKARFTPQPMDTSGGTIKKNKKKNHKDDLFGQTTFPEITLKGLTLRQIKKKRKELGLDI